MSTSALDLIIHKLQKKQYSVILLSEFKEILLSCFDEKLSESRIYKLTYQLRNKWYIISLKKDILYIIDPNKDTDNELIEEQQYWTLLKDHCDNSCWNNRYIWWLTALEFQLHYSNITIPEEIIVFNGKKQAIETVIFDKKVNFKTYSSKGKNIFPVLHKQTNKLRIKWNNIVYANLELAMLECLYNPSPSNQNYIDTLILKAIRQNQKTLSLTNITPIIKAGKHNSSINRLKDLTKKSFPELTQTLEILIKKYWTML